MAKSKREDIVEDAEFQEQLENIYEAAKISADNFINNSFAECVDNIAAIPAELFGDISTNIDRAGVDEWHKPYIEVLKRHGYDMIFFGYNAPIKLTDEVSLEDVEFKQLPTGKGIIIGRDTSNNIKCVTIMLNDLKRAKVLYDPAPDTDLNMIVDVAFFIKTFI